MKYSKERKASVLARLTPPHNQTVQEVADAEGISAATVYNRRKAVVPRSCSRSARSTFQVP